MLAELVFSLFINLFEKCMAGVEIELIHPGASGAPSFKNSGPTSEARDPHLTA